MTGYFSCSAALGVVMLEGLDEIDWKGLHHAYGAADDVPRLLRTLLSRDRNQRDYAAHELFGNIWHQGTVYEATAYAVPFLIELLRCPSTAVAGALGAFLNIAILICHSLIRH